MSTKYRIEVLIQGRDGDEWKAVRPTGGEPYTYETRDEAVKTARMCYPDEVRIVPWEGIRITEFVPFGGED